MRHRYAVCLWLFLFCGALCSAAQREGSAPEDQFLGKWAGTWEGGGAGGGFELTLEKDKAQKDALVGKVSVAGEPAYDVTFKELTFDGTKMSAKYDFPPNGAVEVVLGATFDDKNATGTWLLREKGSGGEVARGTWNVSRKP